MIRTNSLITTYMTNRSEEMQDDFSLSKQLEGEIDWDDGEQARKVFKQQQHFFKDTFDENDEDTLPTSEDNRSTPLRNHDREITPSSSLKRNDGIGWSENVPSWFAHEQTFAMLPEEEPPSLEELRPELLRQERELTGWSDEDYPRSNSSDRLPRECVDYSTEQMRQGMEALMLPSSGGMQSSTGFSGTMQSMRALYESSD